MCFCILSVVLVTMSCSDESDSKIVDIENIVDQNEQKQDANVDSIVVYMMPETTAIELTEEQRSYVLASNDFSIRLYQCANTSKSVADNNILSPLSVTYLLSMLNDGAQGKASDEIIRLLGVGDTEKASLREFCKLVIEKAPSIDPSVILELANVIIGNSSLGVDFEPAYAKCVRDNYAAEVISEDFSQTSAVDRINKWCNEKSHGMIPKIIETLDSNEAFVLMNAIYFSSTWTEKFDKANTQMELFTNSQGKQIQLPMMHNKAQVFCGKNDIYTSVRLPYGSGNRWSMFVLLPNDSKTVDDVINCLADNNWEKDEKEVIADIKIPRFSTKSKTELKDVISSLGASSIFDPKLADFQLISNTYKDFFVGKIFQETAIDVTEEGTKTSAVTVVKGETLNVKSYDNVDFHCNRPFVYVIQEASSGAIFFIGTFRG